MPRGFNGRWFTCGGWGYKAVDHNRVDRSVNRQPPRSEGPGIATHYNEQYGQPAGGFGGVMSLWPGLGQQPQQQQQQQPAMPLGFARAPVADVGQRRSATQNAHAAMVPGVLENVKQEPDTQGQNVTSMSEQSVQEAEATLLRMAVYSAQANRRANERLRRLQPREVVTVNVTGAPGDGPLRGQAGPGALPGARNVRTDPSNGSRFLWGNFLGGRPSSGQAQGHRGRGGKRERLGEDDEDDQDTRARVQKRRRLPVGQEESTDGSRTGDDSTSDDDDSSSSSEEEVFKRLAHTGPVRTQGQENNGQGRGAQGGMAQEQGEVDNDGAEPSRADAEAPRIEDGRSGADRRQQDRPAHLSVSQHEVAAGEVMGLNLNNSDARSLLDRTYSEHPQGTLFKMTLSPMSAEDNAVSSAIVKGRSSGS